MGAVKRQRASSIDKNIMRHRTTE